MLEIIEKSYSTETTAQDLANDFINLYDWYKTEIGEHLCKLYVHETAWIEIKSEERWAPQIHAYINGNMGTGINNGSFGSDLHLHIAKTNSAIVIQGNKDEVGYFNVPKNSDIIIIADATNHHNGTITPAIGMLAKINSSTGIANNQPYICSPEITSDTIVYTEGILYGSGANKMVLVPFFSDASQCTLNGVYLCVRRMTTELYRGECMLSGRKAYMNGWIMIPCE